jgi:hypothetical protein
MKKIFLTALVLTLIPALIRGDESIKNADFTDGINHWEGDGLSVAAEGTGTQGLIIKLQAHDWTRTTQDFRPLQTSGVLKIVFQCSDDLQFSTDPKDYRGITGKAGFSDFKSPRLDPGNWVVFLLETAGVELTYFPIKPAAGTAVQTFTSNVTGLVAREDKIICLAFPPGTGSVTLLHIGLADQ